MIRFQGLHKRFGDHVVLDGVDLEVARGEVFFVVGGSGAGKSVLIKHLVGFLRADAGQIFLDGEEVGHLPGRELPRVRKRCAMVFQHATLFDSMTCLDNVALPLRHHRGLSHRDARAQAMPRLQELRLAEQALQFPGALGDGTRKRVAIARALTLDPEVVLFDEPTTGLDPISARRVDRLIRELSDRRHVTSIVVSHDLTSMFGIADRIAMLYQGKVHALGTPAALSASDDAVVQQFVRGLADGPMVV